MEQRISIITTPSKTTMQLMKKWPAMEDDGLHSMEHTTTKKFHQYILAVK
jgi:hypothetical protein